MKVFHMIMALIQGLLLKILPPLEAIAEIENFKARVVKEIEESIEKKVKKPKNEG